MKKISKYRSSRGPDGPLSMSARRLEHGAGARVRGSVAPEPTHPNAAPGGPPIGRRGSVHDGTIRSDPFIRERGRQHDRRSSTTSGRGVPADSGVSDGPGRRGAAARSVGAERANPRRRAKPIRGAERSQSGPPRRRANPGVQEGRSFVREYPLREPGPAPSGPIAGAERSQSPAPSEANRRRQTKPIAGAERTRGARAARHRSPGDGAPVRRSSGLPKSVRILSRFGPAPFSDSGPRGVGAGGSRRGGGRGRGRQSRGSGHLRAGRGHLRDREGHPSGRTGRPSWAPRRRSDGGGRRGRLS